MAELSTLVTSRPYHDTRSTNLTIDIGRIRLNRKKQKEGVYALKTLCNDKLKPIFASATISGLFAIFHDGTDYFRIKNIPDNVGSREILRSVGLKVYDSVDSIKSGARSSSLASLVKDLISGKITRMTDDKQIDAMKSNLQATGQRTDLSGNYYDFYKNIDTNGTSTTQCRT